MDEEEKERFVQEHCKIHLLEEQCELLRLSLVTRYWAEIIEAIP